MGQFRNITREPYRIGVGLVRPRLVQPDEVVTVADGADECYLLVPHIWKRVAAPAVPVTVAEPSKAAAKRPGSEKG